MEIPQCITTGPRAKDESKEEKKWRKNAVKEERKVRNWFSQVTYGIKTQTCWTMKQKQQQLPKPFFQSTNCFTRTAYTRTQTSFTRIPNLLHEDTNLLYHSINLLFSNTDQSTCTVTQSENFRREYIKR